LQQQTGEPNFWENKEKAARLVEELSELKKDLEVFEGLKKELIEVQQFSKLAQEDKDLRSELIKKVQSLRNGIKETRLQTLLSGKYDRLNAILQISAGAGGTDAQDWATMLLRMYRRYCILKGLKTKVLAHSFGEGGGGEGRIGTKSVILEVKGRFAYGFLKRETGVHRLVRISPFSAKSLRHTSFALVEVLPQLQKTQETQIKIIPEDLRIETFRASGPGGQYVNRRETAVRITHLPTGIKVSCQSERLQGLNREKAMNLLYSKLHYLKVTEEKKTLKKIKGSLASASWGNQIRSYFLHPYRLVKDLRTGIETSDTEEVLDGHLDRFIEAAIEHN